MRKVLFALGLITLLTGTTGAFLRISHRSFADLFLLLSCASGVAFAGVLLYFLLFRVGRRAG
jgi:hypothetical protein